MNKEIFCQWLKNEFHFRVLSYLGKQNLPENVLLVLVNAPAHPLDGLEECSDDSYMFLLVNTKAYYTQRTKVSLSVLRDTGSIFYKIWPFVQTVCTSVSYTHLDVYKRQPSHFLKATTECKDKNLSKIVKIKY